MLRSLLELEFMKNTLETIITDEDAAFIVAFKHIFSCENDILNNIVKHVLCTWHKTKNFKKKINSLGFSEIEKSTYSDLFDCICYSPNNSHAMSCLGKLLKVQSLKGYLEKEVLPNLHQLARSCLESAHCIGYNVTYPAESMNNMLKRNLPDRHLSLLESRLL